MIVRGYIYTPAGQPLPGQTTYIPGQFLYNTGRIDTDAPAGQRCMNPDAAGFYDLASMIAYAAQKGETLRQFSTLEEVNAICSVSSPIVSAPPGGGCTTCSTAAPGAPPTATGNTPGTPGPLSPAPPGGIFGTGVVGGRGVSTGTALVPGKATGTTPSVALAGMPGMDFPWWLVIALVIVFVVFRR